MRKAKAYIEGKLARIMRAEAVTEETRHAYEWRCIEGGCDCTLHWRRAVHAKSNTDVRDATFAKNRSSSHKAGCVRDFSRILHENIDYVTVKNGQIHVRVNFPLGSSNIDRFPQRGYLSQELKKAAEYQKDVKPYSSIKDLAAFMEANLGGLDTEAAGEVVVSYQGQEVEWEKLFKPSDAYDKLYVRATNHKNGKEGSTTSPIITIVRPVREISPNEQGKRRFACEEQQVKIQGISKRQKVIPVIVCDDHDPMVAKQLEKMVRDNATMIVSARPFHPGHQSIAVRYGEQRVSLLVHKLEQIAPVDPKYWKLSYKAGVQLDLFKAIPSAKPAG